MMHFRKTGCIFWIIFRVHFQLYETLQHGSYFISDTFSKLEGSRQYIRISRKWLLVTRNGFEILGNELYFLGENLETSLDRFKPCKKIQNHYRCQRRFFCNFSVDLEGRPTLTPLTSTSTSLSKLWNGLFFWYLVFTFYLSEKTYATKACSWGSIAIL